MALDLGRLDLLAQRIAPDALRGQRWFRSKGRAITGLTLEDAAPLVAQPAERDATLLIVRVSFADAGDDELYLVPMLSEPDGRASQPKGISVLDTETAMVLREPRDGDGVWQRILAGVADEITLPGVHGSFVFHALGAVNARADERLLRGE